MANIVRNISYPIAKKTKKLSILLIVVMLFSTVFNLGIIADGDIKPDLDILSIDFEHIVYEGDIVEVKVLIKNVGTKDISVGTQINAELRIDDILVKTNLYNDGLDIDETCYITFNWKAERGDETERDLEVEVNIEGMSELSYINNFISSSIFVSEGKVDLEFDTNVGIIFDGTPRMNEPIKVSADATNTGRNTTEDINVTMYIGGSYYDDYTINGLLRDEVYTVSFIWIPDDFGTSTIKFSIFSKNKDAIEEQDEDNNYLGPDDVVVQVPRFDWWNTSWHYRKAYKMSGEGNVSVSFNSTLLLDELKIQGNTFENDTVTVVKYFLNGTVDCIVGNYSFNESAKELIWKVTDDTYYCVYFDVENNSGTRIGIPVVDMQTSGSVNIDTGYVEGWWVRPVDEINTYYLPGVQITFKMESTAEIHNMTALLYLEGTFERTLTFTTTDNLIWIKKQTFQQSEIGNWSIEVSGYDDAGYLSEKFTDDFFIGKPDLVVDSISIVSDLPEGSQNYVNNDYTIKANVLVYNASIDNVNITMKINETYFDSTIKNISKNQNNMVSFIWHPTQKGFYTVTIEAKLTNDINDQLSQNITIEGIPDLKILNITVPSDPVDEESPAEIFVNITNIGEGNATNYQVNLYCEQHDKNAMNYTGLKSTTTVDINVSETKSISLIWDSTEYGSDEYEGKWIIGVILVWDEEGHPDSDTTNNWAYNRTARLQVNEIERPEQNNPIITLIKPDILEEFEQNLPVKIIAKITDESGIKSVDIIITAPDKITDEGVMTKQENDKYSYTFENTHILKIYNFTITAVDNSVYENNATKTSNFTIVEDATPPEIDYFGVLPSVQLKDKDVTISSIISDPSGVKFVQVTITYPNDDSETKNMTNASNDEKYYYTQSYEMLGRYVFYITTEDTLGNEKTTKDEEVEFWITTDLEDTDSDGMPDYWEEKYGFDPFDPTDADEDEDDDGYTNLEEYDEDMDPLEPLSLLQRIVLESKENWIYVLVSGILFIVIIALSIYGVQRRKT